MGQCIDITGLRFGKLIVIERSFPNVDGSAMWRCKCDCGNEVVVKSHLLRTGHTNSCGCYLKDYRRSMVKHGYGKHNKYDRLYRVWQSIRRRCYGTSSKSYRWYGAKGVKMCDEWNDYTKFREWAYSHGYDENAPKLHCTIDRINPYGNYEPDNCRWVDIQT